MSQIVVFPDKSIVDAATVISAGPSPAGGIYYYLGATTSHVTKMSPEDVEAKLAELHAAMKAARDGDGEAQNEAITRGIKMGFETLTPEARRLVNGVLEVVEKWSPTPESCREYQSPLTRICSAITAGLAS